MKNIFFKTLFLLFLSAIVFFSAYKINSVLADIPLSEKLKGRILLQVEENGEAWYVNPTDLKRYFLGRPSDAFSLMQKLGRGITDEDLNKIKIAHEYFSGIDSDNDGIPDAVEESIGTDPFNSDTDGDEYNDMEEIVDSYNPKGEGLIKIDEELSKNLSGYIVLQVEKNGEAWYVDPIDLKRYFLGRPSDAFRIMRELGLGISNNDLLKIEEFKDDSEYSSKKIEEKYTVVVEENKKRYYDKDYPYSFEYDSGFTIKKYPEKDNVVFLSDSEKDFFLEGKAIIIAVFIEDKNYKLSDFKIAGIESEEQEIKKINNNNYIEKILKLEYTDKRTAIIEGQNGFLDITMITGSGNISRYDNIYNELIKSVKF